MRDNRCPYIGSCSLCPYLENCPCIDEEFKYYFYRLNRRNSTYKEISHSNNYVEIMKSVSIYLSDKKHLRKNLQLVVTLNGPCSWNNSIRIDYESTRIN